MGQLEILSAHVLNIYRLINSGLDKIPYNKQMSVIFAPGDLIRPEPFSSFGGYLRIKKTVQAQLLPFRTENIAVKWTSKLTKMDISGTQSELPKNTEKFDLNQGELGHWKLLVLTSGNEIEIGQPNENKLFTDKDTVRRLTYANTTYNFKIGNHSQVPEIFTFEDRTPIKYKAFSTDPDRDSYDVIVGAYGFKYTVDLVTFDKYPRETDMHPETKAIVRMGNPERG